MSRHARLIFAFAAAVAAAAIWPAPASAQIPNESFKSWSAMPILMYDNDIGVGYGAKAKFVDYLGAKESFDLILFNSTKGERWYVFTFSIPDFEIRQGKSYGLSFDLKAEYDKFLKYSYYGKGMDSAKDDETLLEHETTNIQMTLGHGFTPKLVLEGSYVLRWIDYRNVEAARPFTEELSALEKRFAPYVSLVLRYDTSDSQIHPTRGFRLYLQDDLAAGAIGSADASFNRMTVDFRKYTTVFGATDVFAFRALVQYVGGSDIPLFDLLSLGGGNTLNVMRGYRLNRFLDRGKILANAEYRFPLLWLLGGNVFVDAGNVWPSLGKIDFGKTALDAGFGLRLYLADFVARADVGFSKEGMGLYFNFGHAF